MARERFGRKEATHNTKLLADFGTEMERRVLFTRRHHGMQNLDGYAYFFLVIFHTNDFSATLQKQIAAAIDELDDKIHLIADTVVLRRLEIHSGRADIPRNLVNLFGIQRQRNCYTFLTAALNYFFIYYHAGCSFRKI